MLNLALVGLMAGSLALSPTDDGKQGTDAPKADQASVVAAGPSIFTTVAEEAPETIQDQYAFGRQYGGSPLRLWVSYSWGEAEGAYLTNGESGEINIALADGDIVSQRAIAGIELGLPVNLLGFGLAAGAEVRMATDDFQCGAAGCGPALGAAGVDGLSSDFGLQGAKFYGELRTNTIGLHAGYQLDLGSEQTFVAVPALGGAMVPTDLSQSDERDALFFGASFDYPTNSNIRLFGGVDYYDVKSNDGADDGDNDLFNTMLGLGLRFTVFEIGAALQMQTRLNGPIVEGIGAPSIGGSLATIQPYLRFSPATFPASFFVRGGVPGEYAEYGLALGGSNSIKPSIGVTAGFTFGFQ